MPTNPKITDILTKIENGRRFLVASHESPDGDAIASTLALVLALRQAGKEAIAFNPDPVPAAFAFLPEAGTFVSTLEGEPPFDVGFVLDAGELRRVGPQVAPLCRILINIDHHPHSELFGLVNWIDERASATGAMICRLLKAGALPISRDVATCIYTAILADTGSFRYSNADPEAFRMAAEMVERGVSTWDIASGLYENQEEKRFRLLAMVLQTLNVSPCGRVASVAATTRMLRDTEAGPEHTDGFINYPRAIHGVEVALFLRQIGPAAFKIGFRSKGKVDVGALARALGGGGHHNAAGAVVEGSLEEVGRLVMERVQGLLDAKEKGEGEGEALL